MSGYGDDRTTFEFHWYNDPPTVLLYWILMTLLGFISGLVLGSVLA